MSAKYVIKWKSKVNGRAGRGTKEFERDEGEKLVAELNEEYPDIEHELMAAPPPRPAENESEHAGKEDHDQQAPVHAES